MVRFTFIALFTYVGLNADPIWQYAIHERTREAQANVRPYFLILNRSYTLESSQGLIRDECGFQRRVSDAENKKMRSYLPWKQCESVLSDTQKQRSFLYNFLYTCDFRGFEGDLRGEELRIEVKGKRVKQLSEGLERGKGDVTRADCALLGERLNGE